MPRKSKAAATDFAEKSSGKNLTYWLDSVPGKNFEALNKDLEVDVVVVGAGIAGVTTSYVLTKAGLKVALVDDGSVGSGETGRTTAHLVNALDDRYHDLVNYFGEKNAKYAAESHTAAVDFIEEVVQKEKIDCDFERVDGYLFLDPSDDIDSLKEDLEAAKQSGLKDIRLLERAPIDSFDTGPCLHYPNQAQFHPMKYLNRLAEIIVKSGGKIFTETHAESFSKEGITTSTGHKIRAEHVVVATNTPVNDRVTMHTKQGPYRTYVIGLQVKKDSIPHILLWDTGDQNEKPYPYHYVRLQNMDKNHDVLISGGEDHKTGQADDFESRFSNLEKWTRERFSDAEKLVYRWSGQVMEPIDSLAFIGRNPGDENIYICTGDSGNGMTHGTIAGILISDLILNKPNPWAEVYDPSRKTLKAAGDFLSENINVAAQFADYVKKGDVEKVEDLEPDEGAVIKKGLKPIAVYKNSHGEIFENSAICPHLGCIVQWNGEEKTFDCPCHGSRFTFAGRVVNGPANKDLDPTSE
jgi:glycine/D-amino acid oxidase-like deaminating enzyme/nitrite reductase/ring-hydroxylating ferredoxin subunit